MFFTLFFASMNCLCCKMSRFCSQNPFKMIPNLFLSQLWSDSAPFLHPFNVFHINQPVGLSADLVSTWSQFIQRRQFPFFLSRFHLKTGSFFKPAKEQMPRNFTTEEKFGEKSEKISILIFAYSSQDIWWSSRQLLWTFLPVSHTHVQVRRNPFSEDKSSNMAAKCRFLSGSTDWSPPTHTHTHNLHRLLLLFLRLQIIQ